MKKGIVLFITLMFIIAISALIVKNLNDAEKYVEVSNSDLFYTKALISQDNLQQEFLLYFSKRQENIESFLENSDFKEGVSFSYGDIQAKVYFEDYSNSYDLNKLKKGDTLFDKSLESYFLENGVLEFVSFKHWVISHILNYGDIRNFEQVNKLVEEFILYTKNSEIKELQKRLSFIDPVSKKLVLGRIEVSYGDKISKSEFIYDVKAKKIEGLNIVF